MASYTIQVVLRDDVKHLGKSGELVRVKPGYARNYLLPRGLAAIATRGNIKQIEHEQRPVTGGGELHPLVAVAGDHDLVAEVAEMQRNQLRDIAFVFDQQDSARIQIDHLGFGSAWRIDLKLHRIITR